MAVPAAVRQGFAEGDRLGRQQFVPLVARGAGRFLRGLATGRGAVGLPAQQVTRASVYALLQPIFDSRVTVAAGLGDLGHIECGALVAGAENIVRAVAIGTARPYREPFLLQCLTVDAEHESLQPSVMQLLVVAAAALFHLAFHADGRLGILDGQEAMGKRAVALGAAQRRAFPLGVFRAGLGVYARTQARNHIHGGAFRFSMYTFVGMALATKIHLVVQFLPHAGRNAVRRNLPLTPTRSTGCPAGRSVSIGVAVEATHFRCGAGRVDSNADGNLVRACVQKGNRFFVAMGAELLDFGQFRTEVVGLVGLGLQNGSVAAVTIDAIHTLLIVNILLQTIHNDAETGLVLVLGVQGVRMALEARVVVVFDVRTFERRHFQRRLRRGRRYSGRLGRSGGRARTGFFGGRGRGTRYSGSRRLACLCRRCFAALGPRHVRLSRGTWRRSLTRGWRRRLVGLPSAGGRNDRLIRRFRIGRPTRGAWCPISRLGIGSRGRCLPPRSGGSVIGGRRRQQDYRQQDRQSNSHLLHCPCNLQIVATQRA